MAAVPPDNDVRGLYQYGSALTRPVRYRSETVLYAPTVGVDEYVDPAQSTPKGRFVLRAASSRPYNCGGKAADGSTNSRPLQRAGGLLERSEYKLEEDAQRVRLAALGLLDKLEQAVTELDKGILTRKEKDGETVFEIQKGKGKGLVDRNGLKQLTGVLKDLQDILCQDDLTTRERELKLKRLEMELSGAADSGITVELVGEAQAYAQ